MATSILPDESINFSNLDSSMAPSQYNELPSSSNRVRQQQKLQQEQILKAASLIEQQSKKNQAAFDSYPKPN